MLLLSAGSQRVVAHGALSSLFRPVEGPPAMF